MIKQFERKCN